MTSFGGQWTEDKLEILRRYLDAYTTALKNQEFRLTYVDAFAGEGYWRPRSEFASEDYEDFREVRDGSPRIALGIEDKPFDRLVFIEQDSERYESLSRLREEFSDRDIEVHNDDANHAIPLFCDGLEGYDRAVVFLDPFDTAVSWDTVARLARTRKVDCWILFPLSAIARIMPTGNEPPPKLAVQLNRVFGGREHWEDFYRIIPPQPTLFGGINQRRPSGSEQIAVRYRQRLETAFAQVAPTRRVFINSRNSPMFDLFFAASNPRGAPIAVQIADHILKNW